MEKPDKRNYGWEEPTINDEDGWCIEGGEEAYYEAVVKYNEQQEQCPGCMGPCGVCEDDALLARILRCRNLRERQVKNSEYDYPKVWLAAIATECHLGLVDIEAVLNAIIHVSENPQQ